MSVGILGYGVYIPSYRIRVADIALVWGKKTEDIEKSLGVREKSVANNDEDAVTLAYAAAQAALIQSGISPQEIDVCMVGSETHPYAVNPTSTIVGEFLGIGRNYFAADLEFACKAGTAGMIAVSGLIEAAYAKKGLVIGSDAAAARPHDILEYTAASAAAAFILEKSGQKSLAEIIDFTSYSSDTPDFWRRDGVRFPSHGGRFTGEPAYFTHIESAAKRLLSKSKMKPNDFAYCVFHMPNGKFPRIAAKRLGFTQQQIAPSLVVDTLGNPYSASSLTGLAAVLDIASPGELIFLVSYGSGAGSDGFIIKTTKQIKSRPVSSSPVSEQLAQKKYISYVEYLKKRRKLA